MFYTGYDGQGYRTGVAASRDLVHWEERGVAMGFGKVGAFDHVPVDADNVCPCTADPDTTGNTEFTGTPPPPPPPNTCTVKNENPYGVARVRPRTRT